MKWQPIETAPRDGTRIVATDGWRRRKTWYGKTSHVPLYGWCWMPHPHDFENVDLWEPKRWRAESTSSGVP